MRLPTEVIYNMLLKYCDNTETRRLFGIFRKIDIPPCLYKIQSIELSDEESYKEVYYVLLNTDFPSAYYFLEYVVDGDRKIRYHSDHSNTYMVFNIEDQTYLQNKFRELD